MVTRMIDAQNGGGELDLIAPPLMGPLEIGFLAGLFEGEGYIDTSRVRMNITSTDRDTLEFGYSMCQFGHINGPYWAKKSTKEFWSWDITDGRQIARFLCAIVSLMSERRREEIQKAAEVLAVRSKHSECLLCGKRIETKMRKNTTKYCSSTCRVAEWRSRKSN